MIGETISHYRILEKLGEGGMGVVYKAEDLRLKRTVALKFLSPRAIGGEEERSRFIHEARAAAGLQHPNICTVHEIDEADGKAFIAMAYIDGPSLQQRIARGPMAIDEVIDAASQLCLGLQEAHEKGIVHRDIKPANVMIDSKGRLAIMDFGLAKSAARSRLTQESTTLGTVAYMSPEQARGEKVDRRSDIWSLGVVIYQMVTGLLPFRADHETALVYAVLNEHPEPITALRTGVPMDLERIVDKATAKDPAERYQNVEDMLVDLRRIRSGASRVSRMSSLHVPPAEEVTQVMPTPFPSSRGARGRTGAPPRLGRKGVLTAAGAVVLLAAAGAFLFLRSDGGREDAPFRVAVAPFDNQTGDSGYDHLGRMTADRIIRGLAETDLVEVVPLSAREAGAGDKGEGASSAGEKRAGALVSGSYYLRGREVEFHVQITDAGDGRLLSVLDAVRGPAGDPEEAIGGVQQRVMGALALLADPEGRGTIGRASRPPTYEALRAQAEGEKALARFEDGAALEHFARAAAGDSTYAEPLLYAALIRIERGEAARAESLARRLERFGDALKPGEAARLDWIRSSLAGDRDAAAEALRRSLEGNPGARWRLRLAREEIDRGRPAAAKSILDAIAAEAEAIAARSEYGKIRAVALHRLGEHEREREAVLRGREMDPHSTEWILAEGRVLAALGRMEDLNGWAEKRLASPPAEGITPGGALVEAAGVLRAKGMRRESNRLLEKAIGWYEGRPEEEGETERHRWDYARALYAAERWDEAWVILETLGFDDPENLDYIAALGAVSARRGDREAALRHLRSLEKSKEEVFPGKKERLTGAVYALLGDKTEALARLRAAVDAGWSRAEMEERMDLESLAADPAFRRILRPVD